LENILKTKIGLLLCLMAGLFILMACSDPHTSELPDSTWLSPGKIQINNLHPGSSITQKIKIHNGNKLAIKFSVYYRIPDYVENNYAVAPGNAGNWISIEDSSPTLEPQETKEIRIGLTLPDEVQLPERWEFWIGAKETKGNMLATELCSRWLITMRQ
jgi:hypothetical protein